MSKLIRFLKFLLKIHFVQHAVSYLAVILVHFPNNRSRRFGDKIFDLLLRASENPILIKNSIERCKRIISFLNISPQGLTSISFTLDKHLGYINDAIENIKALPETHSLRLSFHVLKFMLQNRQESIFKIGLKKLAFDPKSKIKHNLLHAEFALIQKDFNKVERIYEKAKIEKSSSDDLTHLYIDSLVSNYKFEKAESIYFQLLKQKTTPKLVNRVGKFLLMIGDFKKLMLFLDNYQDIYRSFPALYGFLLRAHWLNGTNSKLEQLAETSSLAQISHISTLRIAADIRSQCPGFNLILKRVEKSIDQFKISQPRNYLLICSLLGLWERIENTTPCWPEDYEAHAKLFFERRDFDNLKRILIETEKIQFASWSMDYWLNLYMYTDDDSIFQKLELRDEKKWDFTTRTKDNYLLRPNIHLQHLLWRKGEYAQGLGLNFERNLCRFLEHKYPGKYFGKNIKSEHFKNGMKVFIVGNDGVGDEVRWSRHWKFLEEKDLDVEISCDPRLQNIFERSFPKFKFHPVHRKWANIKVRDNQIRVKPKSRDLSNLLTDDLIEKLEEADLILVGQEVVFHSWNITPPKTLFNEKPYLVPNNTIKFKESVDSGNKKLKVGLILSSKLITQQRARHYISIHDIDHKILDDDNYNFYFLGKTGSMEEKESLEAKGIKTLDHIDFYSDFESASAFMKNLDVCVGISTLTMELGAAIGTQQILLGISPETYHIRKDKNSNEDVFTIKTQVICPNSYNTPEKNIIDQINKELSIRLNDMSNSIG